MASGILIFTHILPVILGFFGVILLISGIMERKRPLTVLGIILFFIAGILPFIVIPYMI